MEYLGQTPVFTNFGNEMSRVKQLELHIIQLVEQLLTTYNLTLKKMIELKEWIKDGIDIRKTNEGYVVFTIPTQHFNIKELDELTPERFSKEVEIQEKNIELQNELLGEAFGKRVEAGLFKDLFD